MCTVGHGRSGHWCWGDVLVRVKALADVSTEHAVPLGDRSIEQAARDAACRGLADALTITGSGTGEPAEMEDVERTRGVLARSASSQCTSYRVGTVGDREPGVAADRDVGECPRIYTGR